MSSDKRYPNYFSREYRPKSSITADDERMRVRIAEYLDSFFEDKEHEIGKYITQELGIDLRDIGYSGYFIEWRKKIGEMRIEDFLDVITACCKFSPSKTEYEGRKIIKYNLIRFVEKVFREQKVAYRMDEHGGIHPFVDANLTKEVEVTVSALSDAFQTATLTHFEAAERSLLEPTQDTRGGVSKPCWFFLCSLAPVG